MSERVDNELRRVATAIAEVSPPKPELPRPDATRQVPRLVIAAASFLVVLGLGLAASLLFGPAEPRAPGIVPVPEQHAANQVLAQEAGPSEIWNLSVEMGFYFACGMGRGLESCVVWEAGVAVIIPYRVPEGATAEVSTPSHEGRLEIPFEAGEPIAVVHESGPFTILQHVPGVDTPYSYSTDFPPASNP